jgi:hypothetical protein
MKAKESEYRAALDSADRTEPVNPDLSSFLPKRPYDEEMREQVRDLEYQAGWTQRNCNQFFTGLLRSERNPRSHSLASQEISELGHDREFFLLMRDCFTCSQPVLQAMENHVLNRVQGVSRHIIHTVGGNDDGSLTLGSGRRIFITPKC